jgi:fucokinase
VNKPPESPPLWDYLIVTAANDLQAAAYESQIQFRREIGLLPQVRDILVIPDREGRRIGSGGSTLQCLDEVLRRETRPSGMPGDGQRAETILRRLRILIVHAGGDSRRLPAYSPCGKIFIPLPGDPGPGLSSTLFDRLVPEFLSLPAGAPGAGQVVVGAGDALIRFDPAEAHFGNPGITGLGAPALPAEAARHGVLCPNADGSVRLYLQKPDVRTQIAAGAIGPDGRSVLDIGIMSLDAAAAAALLQAFKAPSADAEMQSHSIDLYREICCALGTEATLSHYVKTARASRSTLGDAVLESLFAALRPIPLHVRVLDECDFLHFGSTSQLISSGVELITGDQGAPPPNAIIAMNNDMPATGAIAGRESWVEGCRLSAPLRLRGRNVVVGVDVLEPLELPAGACLDVSLGLDRNGRKVCFIRCCGVDDTFKTSAAEGATFCGVRLEEWLQFSGAPLSSIWDDGIPETERTLWNAKVFPAEQDCGSFRRWLWMFDIANATAEQKSGFRFANRYSSTEIAVRADHTAFHARRAALRTAARRK